MGHRAGPGVLKKRKIFLERMKKKSEVWQVENLSSGRIENQMFKNTRIEICFCSLSLSLSLPLIFNRIFIFITLSYFCIFCCLLVIQRPFLHTQLLISQAYFLHLQHRRPCNVYMHSATTNCDISSQYQASVLRCSISLIAVASRQEATVADNAI